MHKPSRRAFLTITPVFGLAGAMPGLGQTAASPQEAKPAAPQTTTSIPTVGPTFPTQDPALAREMVGASHANLKRVEELLAKHPTLARATWDWGFGDWEEAIGAASHMGNRPIAELLLAHGARPSIFSAAMLGQLGVVRAFVAASPGIQRTKGPHGITLLAHAKAGGEGALEVVKFLESVGDADLRPATQPLSEAEVAQLVGGYAFGETVDAQIAIEQTKSGLTFTRKGATARNLFHLGSYVFYPAGAEAVRIRFQISGGKATALTVHDPDVVLTARRATA